MTASTTTTNESLSLGSWPERTPRSRSLLLRGIAVSALACGCAPETPKSSPKTEAPRPHYALADYLPPTGLSLALQLRPKALFADSEVGSALMEFLPAERLRGFTQATGVVLSHLDEVWIATYELGTLYLVPHLHAESAGATFLAHSESQALERTWAQGLTSYTVVRARVPYSLVLDAGVFTAISERDPTLGRLVVLRALGKLNRFPSAVARSGFEKFPPAPHALAALYWTGPWPSRESPSQELQTQMGDFAAGIEVGRLTLTRETTGLVAHVWVRGTLGEEPSAAWRDYLGALAERAEFRAIFGPNFRLPEGACPEATPEFASCEVRTPVDAQALLARFGQLLRGALDSF